MKKMIDIPEDGRRFTAYAGRELIAFTDADGDFLYVKTESCNYCGECCMDSPGTVYGDDDEGKCNKLKRFGDTWECTAGAEAPWNCLDDPNREEYPMCSIRYKKRPLK